MPPTRHRFFIPMIRFDQVSFRYHEDGRPILNDLSFSLNVGDDLVIMGGNGSGKTTLGYLLCGVYAPSSGSISINGQTPGELSDQSATGFLFQDPDNGLVATTVEREVAFSLENDNLPTAEIQARVRGALQRFGLDQAPERLVWHLSGGEKQRLSLAAILTAGRKIFFLDEPASYLDFTSTRLLEETLREVKQNAGISIIRVTQSLAVAEQYPRMLLLSEGRICRDGPPSSVLSDSKIMHAAGLRPPLKYLKSRPLSAQRTDQISLPFAESAPEVILDGIGFAYDDTQTLPLFQNLSLTIKRGEVIGLAGPTGCGKSTLAQLICGIYKPLHGAINFPQAGSRAVMSFQQPERQFFLDTVYDEVAFGLRKVLFGSSLDDAVRGSLSMVGLEYDAFRDRDPHTLSGGEARRLAFAVVIALRADLLIFDEPTCGLDEIGLAMFRRLVTELKKARTTVMIISHNSDTLADLCDRIALIRDGKIGAVVPVLEFFADHEAQEMLAIPEIIDWQKRELGTIRTTRIADLFNLTPFSP